MSAIGLLLLMAVVALLLVVGAGGAQAAGGASAAASTTRPSGEIVFTRSVKEGSRPGLYVMAENGAQVRLLVRSAADASVSPDGRRIALRARRGDLGYGS